VNFCESVRVAPVKRREVMAECIVEVPSWLACLRATAAPREMCRLLRIAEEYDKLGERYAEWQGQRTISSRRSARTAGPPPASLRTSSLSWRSASRLPSMQDDFGKSGTFVKVRSEHR
jgi:hypothetical protein